jgi:hypothetical protein
MIVERGTAQDLEEILSLQRLGYRAFKRRSPPSHTVVYLEKVIRAEAAESRGGTA